MKPIFTGAAVAIITPMNEDGSIFYDELEKMIDFQIKMGTDAIVICGTTGEASTLSHEEQIECIQFAVKKTAGRVPVIAGAGSNSTSQAIYLAQQCEKAAADAVLVVTPYYNKTTQAGLIAHYKAIAESISIPMILYNVPGRTGMNIAPETCQVLSTVSNIVGIKEASGNLSQAAKIASLCGPEFTIYSGNDDQILPILSLGGKGVISVLSNVAPQNVHNMVRSFLEGETQEAIRLQLEAIPLIDALFCEVNPIPVKEALTMMGRPVGPCKLPLVPMSQEHKIQLKNELEKYGLLS